MRNRQCWHKPCCLTLTEAMHLHAGKAGGNEDARAQEQSRCSPLSTTAS